MTVKSIRLENFMAFEDSGWLELRPICLLFGRNSSGKSAIIRALRLLKQSLDGSSKDGPLVFMTEEGIDQGSYKETVHHTDHREPQAASSQSEEIDLPPITYHFRCRLLNTLDILREIVKEKVQEPQIARMGDEVSEDWVDFSLRYVWNKETKQAELDGFSIDCPWMTNEGFNQCAVFLAQRVEFEVTDLTGGDWFFDSHFLHGHEVGDGESVWVDVSVERTSGFLPRLVRHDAQVQKSQTSLFDFRFVSALMQELCKIVEDFLQNIEYLGPIRTEPRRIYVIDRLTNSRWQRRGLNSFLNFLIAGLDEPQYKQIDSWWDKLGLGIKIGPTSENNAGGRVTVSQIRTCEAEGSSFINLKDIGFGASQVLPVLIQSLLAEKTLVVIEQPELHLHPEAQARLADFFIECVSKENSPRFILETHSEHFLLRLQRRVAETSYESKKSTLDQEPSVSNTDEKKLRNEGFALDRSQLGIIFVTRFQGDSQTEFIQINDRGELVVDKRGELEPPSTAFQDFFRQDYEDVMCLTRVISDIVNLEQHDERGN